MTGREYTREEWGALLARAPVERLTPLADEAIASADSFTVLRAPRAGTVVAQVREPLAQERFILGDVLVTSAEVDLGGSRGWAMRVGGGPEAALAQAVLDAELAARGDLSERVLAVLAELDEKIRRERAETWERLAPTIVEFEEIA